MNFIVKSYIIILLVSQSMAGCSSDPKSQGSQFNSPQTQKENAKQAQHELSSESAK